MKLKVKRTVNNDPDFILLTDQLNELLSIVDGEDHAYYSKFNHLNVLDEVVVIYNDDQPIACGALKKFDLERAEVKRMFTIDSFRGQGVAKKILDELELWAREIGYSKIVLETGAKLESAVKLYDGYGYQRIANYGQYIGLETSVCFEKQL